MKIVIKNHSKQYDNKTDLTKTKYLTKNTVREHLITNEQILLMSIFTHNKYLISSFSQTEFIYSINNLLEFRMLCLSFCNGSLFL